MFKKAFLQESDEILGTEEAAVAARGSEIHVGRDSAWAWVEGVEREGQRRMLQQKEKDATEISGTYRCNGGGEAGLGVKLVRITDSPRSPGALNELRTNKEKLCE